MLTGLVTWAATEIKKIGPLEVKVQRNERDVERIMSKLDKINDGIKKLLERK